MKYFWKDAGGLAADIARHRAKQAELDAKIAELETQGDPMSIAALGVYRDLRARLLESKAVVVAAIGSAKKSKK